MHIVLWLPDGADDEQIVPRAQAIGLAMRPISGMYAALSGRPRMRRLPEPDWPSVIRELRRPGVNLTVLWEEYREVHPEGYGYSRFCDLHRAFERWLTPVMRQHHAAGDKVFVDDSGKKVGIIGTHIRIADPSQIGTYRELCQR